MCDSTFFVDIISRISHFSGLSAYSQWKYDLVISSVVWLFMCTLRLRSICKSLASESAMFSPCLYLLAASQAEVVASSSLPVQMVNPFQAITTALHKMLGGGGQRTAETNLKNRMTLLVDLTRICFEAFKTYDVSSSHSSSLFPCSMTLLMYS